MIKKKIRNVFFTLLIVNIFLSVFSMTVLGYNLEGNNINETVLSSNNYDEIEEQQTNYNDYYLLDNPSGINKKGVVQSFIYSDYTVSINKIELFVSKIGNVTSPLSVGIRMVSRNDPFIGIFLYSSMNDFFDTSVTIPSHKVSSSGRWIKFDFEDIEVDHSKCNAYLILVKGYDENTDSDNCYAIGYSKGLNSYKNGKLADVRQMPRYSTDGRWCHGFSTDDHLYDDLAFKVYTTKSNNYQPADLVPHLDIIKSSTPGINIAVFKIINQGQTPAKFSHHQKLANITFFHKLDDDNHYGIIPSNDLTLEPGDSFDAVAWLFEYPHISINVYKLEANVDPLNLIYEGLEGESNNFKSADYPQKPKVRINNDLMDHQMFPILRLFQRLPFLLELYEKLNLVILQ